MTEPLDAAADLVDQLDWCTPVEILDHLALPPEGFTRRPVAALDPATGRTIAVCASAFEVDVLSALAATHRTDPAISALLPIACHPDATTDSLVHFRTRRLFGERTNP
jgi:hypothetical protein